MEPGRTIAGLFYRGTYEEYEAVKGEGGVSEEWLLDDEVLPGPGMPDIPV